MGKVKTFFRLIALAGTLGLVLATITAVRERSVRESDREAMRIALEDAARRVRSTAANVVEVTEMNNRAALAIAHALAAIVAKDPTILDDEARFMALRETLDAEELHVADEEGIVRWTTIPDESLDFDLSAFEQSRPFLEGITNKDFALAQEPMIKPQVGKLVQFVGVARVDCPGVVQITYNADRVAKAKELADVQLIASSMRVGRTGRVEISPSSTGEKKSSLRLENTEEGRFYVCEGFAEGNRILVKMPVYGSYLADDIPFTCLCILDILVLILIALTRFASVGRMFARHFQALGVLFSNVPRSSMAKRSGFMRALVHPLTHAGIVAFVLIGVACWYFFSWTERTNAEADLRRAAEEMHDQMRFGIEFVKEVARDRSIGKAGFYLIAREDTGEIVACGRAAVEKGKDEKETLAGVGFDVSASPNNPREFFSSIIYGQKCLCLNATSGQYREIVAMPLSAIDEEVRKTVFGAMAVFFVVFAFVAFFLARLSNLVASLKSYIADAAERARGEMAMAKSIQTNVLPSIFPPYPALTNIIDINALMRTAREVGGDFYDFYFVGPDRLALVIADVSGKGVSAALFMMRAKATIQALLKSGLEIVEAMEKANHRLAINNDANMFVTAWIGIVDLKTGELEYVNAGHNPPLVKRVGGEVEYLNVKSGPVLAAMDGVSYTRQTLNLGLRDGIILYTDGVTEATNSAEELYGDERLLSTVRGLLGAHDSGMMINGILQSVDAFTRGVEQSDDITILAFRRLSALVDKKV